MATLETNKIEPYILFQYSMLMYLGEVAALNTLIFSRYTSWFPDAPSEGHTSSPRGKAQPDSTMPFNGPPIQAQSSMLLSRGRVWEESEAVTNSVPVLSRNGMGKLWNHLWNCASRTQYLEASNMEPARTCSSMNIVTPTQV